MISFLGGVLVAVCGCKAALAPEAQHLFCAYPGAVPRVTGWGGSLAGNIRFGVFFDVFLLPGIFSSRYFFAHPYCLFDLSLVLSSILFQKYP